MASNWMFLLRFCIDFVLLRDSLFFSVAVFEEASWYVVRRPIERVTWQGTDSDL